jgi:hypothetical protein
MFFRAIRPRFLGEKGLAMRTACWVAAAFLVLGGSASAQDLTFVGINGRTQLLTAAEIAAMPHVTLTVTV